MDTITVEEDHSYRNDLGLLRFPAVSLGVEELGGHFSGAGNLRDGWTEPPGIPPSPPPRSGIMGVVLINSWLSNKIINPLNT